jgi:hypothetical protein
MPLVPGLSGLPITPVSPAIQAGLFAQTWMQQHPIPPPQMPAPVPLPLPTFIQVLRTMPDSIPHTPYVSPVPVQGSQNSVTGTLPQVVGAAQVVSGGGEVFGPWGPDFPPGLGETGAKLFNLTPQQKALVTAVNSCRSWNDLLQLWKVTHFDPYPFPQWKINLMTNIRAHVKLSPQDEFAMNKDEGALCASLHHYGAA